MKSANKFLIPICILIVGLLLIYPVFAANDKDFLPGESAPSIPADSTLPSQKDQQIKSKQMLKDQNNKIRPPRSPEIKEEPIDCKDLVRDSSRKDTDCDKTKNTLEYIN